MFSLRGGPRAREIYRGRGRECSLCVGSPRARGNLQGERGPEGGNVLCVLGSPRARGKLQGRGAQRPGMFSAIGAPRARENSSARGAPESSPKGLPRGVSGGFPSIFCGIPLILCAFSGAFPLKFDDFCLAFRQFFALCQAENAHLHGQF